MDLIRELYDAFQRVQFDRWDAIIADDVLINSRAGSIRGLKTLKEFAAHVTGLGYRIDLVDEYLFLDQQGNGRGFITLMLHWKHTRYFAGLAPTAGEGKSEETMLLTIDSHKIVGIDDLAIYEWERGCAVPDNARSEGIIVGTGLPSCGLRPTGAADTVHDTISDPPNYPTAEAQS
jgi:hypothetical protein